MVAYIARRTLLAALTMLIMSAITFWVMNLPDGDYVDQLIFLDNQGTGMGGAIPEARLREFYGLDKPLVVQYYKWISRIVTKLQFGDSFETAALSGSGFYFRTKTIREVIQQPILLTIALTAWTIAFTWVMGVPIGIYSAVRQHTIGDYVFTFIGFSGLAVPDFLLGLVLMYLFFAYFDMSVGGLFSGEFEKAEWSMAKVWDLIKHMIIPGIVLGTSGTAGLIRVMRNNLLDELGRPYVTTARAKGMASWKVVVKYPVRVAINPFISGIGSMLPTLVGGSVIVSVVLSLPTLGPVLLKSIQDKDQFLAGAIILMLGFLSVLGILISDLMLVLVDPRIKLYGPGSSTN